MTAARATGSRLHDRMVFVVGAPRSGTTWLQRMLSVHPDVVALPSETHLFSVGLSALRDQTQGHLLESGSTATWFMTADGFADAARGFADAAFSSYVDRVRPDAARIIERSPSHVWHLGLIADVYPDAWVLHIVRDGRDVARSQVAQSWGPAELGQAARLWATSIRAARAAAPSVPRYREVRYEELLAEPKRIADVFEFLDLPAGGDILDVALVESGRVVNVDPTRPDVAEGKWRLEWTPDHVHVFENEAGDALDLLGYPRLPSLVGNAPAAAQPVRRRRRSRVRDAVRRYSAPPTTFRPAPERWQEQVTALVGALATADARALPAMFTDAAEVRVDGADARWVAHGSGAGDRLARHVQAAGGWGAPVRGEQSIDGRTWTLALTYRADDGSLVDRVLSVTIAASGLVERLVWRQFPLGPAGTSTS